LIAIGFSHSTTIAEFKYGIAVLIPTVALILSLAIRDKSKSYALPKPGRKILEKAGQATFVLYITHWAWVGVLRYFLSSVSNVLLMFLIMICLLSPITFLGHLVQKNMVSVFTYWKARKGERLKASLIALALFFSLSVINTNFPRAWTVNTLGFNNDVQMQVLENYRDPKTEQIALRVKITNLSREIKELNYCYVLAKNAKLLSQQQINPVWIEMSGSISPMNSTTVQLNFGFPFQLYDQPGEFLFTGICD
jgi:Na+/melibiose symporter-like transporter